MKPNRLCIAMLLGGAVVVALSCADPSAPAVPTPPQAGLWDDLFGNNPTGLLQCAPLPYDSVMQTIGPEGGTIYVGPHQFTVPAGALDSAVDITAIVLPDTVNRVRFQPEGLVFSQSAILRMSYANCNLLGSLLPKRIAFVAPDLSILDYIPSLDIFWTQTVRGKIDHFSDYALAW